MEVTGQVRDGLSSPRRISDEEGSGRGTFHDGESTGWFLEVRPRWIGGWCGDREKGWVWGRRLELLT